MGKADHTENHLKMYDGTSCEKIRVRPEQETKTPYFTHKRVPDVAHRRAYSRRLVAEQETMLNVLRLTRQQMEREDRELREWRTLQELRQAPKRWTPKYE